MHSNVLHSNLKAFDGLVEVTINDEAIGKFVSTMEMSDSSSSELQLFEQDWDLADAFKLSLIFNSMNFCYWAEQGAEKWSIQIGGENLDGSIALVKLLEQLATDNSDFLDWAYLAKLDIEEFRDFFAGSNVEIPLLQQRYENLYSLANCLQDHYQNDAGKLLRESRNCAARLLKRIVQIPSYQDQSVYRGESVYYWKRAQLQVKMFNDLSVSKGNKPMQNLHVLTAFADYKVPQILRHLGILEYSTKLAEMIDNYQLIAEGSDLENEIRIATIIAVDRITTQAQESGFEVITAKIDSMLWNRAASNKDPMQPYHRTYTTAY